MIALVTGGCGFIGGHLARSLAARGLRVRVLDNLSSGRRERLAGLDAELVEADVRDAEAVRAAAEGAELIFHLGALVSVQRSVEQPLLAYAINTTGTLHVLEAARAVGARVVQASTCAVYGESTRLPLPEDEPARPVSPYAASKLAAEQAGQLYARLYGLRVAALRFFNVYGPGQDPASPYAAVVPRFVQALRRGEPPTIYGDGQQTRDFVFVGDVVDALWAAAEAPAAAGSVFNVGCGQEHSVLELARTLGAIMGVGVAPRHAPGRDGEVRRSCADTRLLAEVAGFRATTELRDGLAEVLKIEDWKIED